MSEFTAVVPAVIASFAAPARTVLACEWTLVREGLAHLCHAFPGITVAAQVGTAAEALAEIERRKPELALLDTDLSDLAVPEMLARLHKQRVPTKCLVFGEKREGRAVLDLLRAGAAGYLVTSAPVLELAEAFRHVLAGGVYLSPAINLSALAQTTTRTKNVSDPIARLNRREYQVFSLLVEGVRAKEIAARLALSPKTVDTYRANLMRKLEIWDLPGLVKFAFARKLTA